MGKVIIVLIILGLIYFFFIKKPSVIQESKEKKDKTKQLDEETMIECKECGVYVSVKDSIIKDGLHYCSKECARLL